MSEIVYNDFKQKVYYDTYSGFFYIQDQEGNSISNIHILDDTIFIDTSLTQDIIEEIRNNLTNTCKSCNEKFVINKYKDLCNKDCKYTYNQKLRKHQTYLLSDEIKAIKNRIYNCEYCNKLLEDKHADHILPLQEYKHNNYDNIAIVCPHCNSSKSNKDLLEWAETKGLDLPKHIINHYYWLKKNIK